MSNVRAKFTCNSVREFAGGSKQVEFSAVYSQAGENADFAKATPNGNLTIGIDSETAAVDFFQPGKSYYLDFTEA